jgi:hypothetical protein
VPAFANMAIELGNSLYVPFFGPYRVLEGRNE